MYVKTQWVDNTTPIDKDNLNKIEQGIYDNSLVVDAITNTLNPTDTETYKTAELTEGQITDVIGVNDIVIKGQTSQDEEPTPSSPVDVNVVSGSNVINTSNKNILNLKKLYRSSSNVTYNFQTTNSVSASGTTAYNSFVFFMENKIKNNNYTLSFKMKELGISSKKRVQIIGNNSQITTGSTTIQNKSLGTLTINTEITDNVSFNSGSYDYIGLVFWNNDSGTALSTSTIWNITEMQLEQGSTATTYEPHQGKELPLDLPVENLINVNEFTSVAAAKIVSNATSGQTVNGIVAKPGTYIASFNVKQLARSDHRMQLVASSDSTQTQSGNDITNKLNTITVDAYQLKRYSISITLEQECYLYLRCVDTECVLNEIQLEKGSKANAYTPYGTEPIELCKIGDYQDYFYKSGSKWYLHKEINKKVFNGSENWRLANSGTSNYYYYYNLGHTTIQSSSIASTHYPYAFISNSNTEQGILVLADGNIRIRYGTEDTVANFKTWLATNNVSVYYLLATAINTEITNTTLISQLEAIYNAPLYEQTNITQTNNDLPMVLDITACKDNINGIKAFIRK